MHDDADELLRLLSADEIALFSNVVKDHEKEDSSDGLGSVCTQMSVTSAASLVCSRSETQDDRRR